MNLQENSRNYVETSACDEDGFLNYVDLYKALVLEACLDTTGSIVGKWHLR